MKNSECAELPLTLLIHLLTHMYGLLGLEDEELQELLRYIPELDENRLEALKMMLRDFVTVHQFNRLTNRQGKAG